MNYCFQSCRNYIIKVLQQLLLKSRVFLSLFCAPRELCFSEGKKGLSEGGSFARGQSFFPQRKTGFARSAGCSAQLISKDHQYCRVRLASGQHRLFHLKTTATLGLVSNSLKRQITIGKAGRSRWLNKRPIVSGVAMNPIDHPHGGKTSGGRPSVTPWGKLTKGQPTRKRKFNKVIPRIQGQKSYCSANRSTDRSTNRSTDRSTDRSAKN